MSRIHATIALPFDQYQRYKIIQEAIDLLRDGEAPLTILDVGGWPGTLRRFLPSDRVAVADLQNTEGDSVRADGCRLPFPNRSFDAVVSSDTFEHIPPHSRPQFLGELARVTKGPLLLCAPFDDPQVAQAEEILQQLIVARYGERYHFIEEHRQNGLPDLRGTLSLLHDAGFHTVVLPNGYLYRWIVGISLWFLLQSRFDDPELSARVNAFYNRCFYRQDNLEPSYRKLVVAARGGEAALSHLPDALVAPATHDPAADLMAVQALNLLVQMLGERWSERALQAEAEVARLTQELDTIYTSKTWRIASKGLRVYQLAEAAGRRLDEWRRKAWWSK
jgi:SAM-dependent methyltransferase